MTRGRLILALNLLLMLAVASSFWRSSMALHEDAIVYLDTAEDIVEGKGPYVIIRAWIDDGYWMGDPRPRPTVEENPYVYPPVLAIVLIPLLALPRETAIYICFLAGFLAVMVAAFVLARLLVGRSLTGFLLVAMLMVYFQPIRRNFWFAQVDTVVLGFLVLGLAAFAARRDLLAGLLVACGVAIKPFAGFVVLYFLWKRSYRAAAATVLASALLVGGSLLALGPHTVLDYIAGTTYWAGSQAGSTIANQSPSGMLLRAFTSNNGPPDIADLPWLVLPLRILVAVMVVGALSRLVSRERRLHAPTLVAEYGLMLLGMIVVSPLGEDLHFVYFAVPLLGCGMLLYRTWDRSWQTRLIGASLVLTYGVFLYPMHTLLTQDGPFVALCALTVVCTLAVLRDVRRRPQTTPVVAFQVAGAAGSGP
jgi:hypothetical protein